jgi:hypothetical protein
MNRDDILNKIRALLRLAKSDNAHEAQLAMQRALEIAAKHQIDLSSLSPEDDLNRLTGDFLNLPSRLAFEYKEALNTAHGFFNVNVTVLIGMDNKRALIVGTKLDIELASYVVTYLVRASRQSLAAYRAAEKAARRRMTPGKAQNYLKGFFWGVRDALRQQQKAVQAAHSGYQLALDNGRTARDEAAQPFLQAEKAGPSTALATREHRVNRAASFRGFLAGSQTQIRPGLRGGAPRVLE